MHLLFYGGTQVKILHNQTVEGVLKELSLKVRVYYPPRPPSQMPDNLAPLLFSKEKPTTLQSRSGLSLRSSRHTPSKQTSFSNRTSKSIRHSMNSFLGMSYHIPTSVRLQSDLCPARRKLKPDARPVQNESDPAGICSAADSRLTVYDSVDLAKKFWSALGPCVSCLPSDTHLI